MQLIHSIKLVGCSYTSGTRRVIHLHTVTMVSLLPVSSESMQALASCTVPIQLKVTGDDVLVEEWLRGAVSDL